MKVLTIDRSKWLCGHELNLHKGKDSMLVNHEGQMCCLGFLGTQYGGTEENMLELYTPAGCQFVNWPAGVLKNCEDSPWTAVAVRINDNNELRDLDREMMLIDHFKAIGVSLQFTGHYTDQLTS